ncbi:hypothetical protein V493_08023 [Pseudogymnoascus sp. VKM F-4281 (FW-2241)]|nr:hypothetical protein V493_08023 [Pseudogymnoascus sp. VKM F-4281 (FW-2241)]
MLYRKQYTDSGLLLSTVQAKKSPGMPRLNGMYNKVETPGKYGALKSLVSKFESLSSASWNSREAGEQQTGVGKPKEKGWRTVVFLKKRTRRIEESAEASSDTYFVEVKRMSPMNNGELGPFVKNHDNTGLKCQTSPIVRGKKERRKGRLVAKRESDDSQAAPFDANRNLKADTEASLTLEVESSGERKESLVQMRIRLLEKSHRTQQNCNNTIPKERKDSNYEAANTGECHRTGGLRRGIEGKVGAEPHKTHPHRAFRHSKPDIPMSATDNSAMSVRSPKVSLEMHAACSVNQKPETAARLKTEAQQEPIEPPALKLPFYRLGTRNREESSLKILAPIILERMKMFESTILNEPSACLRERINGKDKAKHESGGEIFGGVKEVVGENHVNVGWSNPTTNQLSKTMNAFSKCLAERTRSRTGCMVDGNYVSAFAYTRSTKETSSSSSWATTTASRELESSCLNDNSTKPTCSRPITRENGIAPRHILQRMSEQRSIKSPSDGIMRQRRSQTDTLGAWVDSESSSDDEDGTLIVKSVAKLREPKPLRITEASSLARICRLGSSRGDLE